MELEPIFALSLGSLLGSPADLLNNVYAVALTILGIGFVIFIHELGHFAVAKWAGVKVEMFSIGFGPTLFSWRRGFGLRKGSTVRAYEARLASATDEEESRALHEQYGETEYSIRALPLGGFVKVLGMEPGDETVEPGEPRAFFNRPVSARMAIMSAGVVMNLLFGIFCATYIHMAGKPVTPAIIGGVVAGQPAYEAGIRPGDEVVALDGRGDVSFEDLSNAAQVSRAGQKLHFTLKRPGRDEPINVEVQPERQEGAQTPTVGILPGRSLVVAGKPPAGLVSVSDDDRYDQVVAAGPEGEKPEPVKDASALDALLARERSRPVKVVADRFPGEALTSRKPISPEKRVEVALPPTPYRDLGLRMTLGPIAAVRPDSPASRTGLRAGDQIVSIDGKSDFDPMRLPEIALDLAGKAIPVVIRRKGETAESTVEVTPDASPIGTEPTVRNEPLEVPGLGLAVAVEPKVAAVAPGSPAERAKVPVGAVVQSVQFAEGPPASAGQEPKWQRQALPLDGKSGAWPSVWETLQGGEPLPIRLELADGKAVALTPEPVPGWYDPSHGLSFAGQIKIHDPEPLPTALRKGTRDAGNMAFSIVGLLRNLVARRVGTAGFVGPPGIIAMSIRIAKQGGLAGLLPFLGMLSINLAVLNLLPIPPLDGGRLVFLAAEKIRGRPLPEGAVAYPMIAGVVLIILLFVVVSLKDVLNFF